MPHRFPINHHQTCRTPFSYKSSSQITYWILAIIKIFTKQTSEFHTSYHSTRISHEEKRLLCQCLQCRKRDLESRIRCVNGTELLSELNPARIPIYNKCTSTFFAFYTLKHERANSWNAGLSGSLTCGRRRI